MSSFLGKVLEKVIDVIDDITGAKKTSNNTTTIAKNDTTKQPGAISSIFGTAQALAGGIDPNYYPRVSGNNKLKGVLFTKLIN